MNSQMIGKLKLFRTTNTSSFLYKSKTIEHGNRLLYLIVMCFRQD